MGVVGSYLDPLECHHGLGHLVKKWLVLLVGGSLWIVPTNAIDGHCSQSSNFILLPCLLLHELSPHMASILSKSFEMITNPLFFCVSRESYLRSNIESHLGHVINYKFECSSLRPAL